MRWVLAALLMGAACSSPQHVHTGEVRRAKPIPSGWEGGVTAPERMQDLDEVAPAEAFFCTVYFESDDIFVWQEEIDACVDKLGPGHPKCVRMSDCYHVDMWGPPE